jgi:tetratricopeptide (TPR) repeat protein
MSRPAVLAVATVLVAAAAGRLPAQQHAQPKTPPPTLEQLESRARQDSLDPEARFLLARRYYRLNRLNDEERELRATIAVDPRYAPAYLWLSDLPFDRRPKLWEEDRKGKVPEALRPAVEESRRLRRQAFLIDPMVDFRVVGAKAPPEDMVVLPDYGRYTTELMLWLGIGAFGEGRYELAHGALKAWVERAHPKQPRDSLPDFLFWFRGLSAAHQRAYTVATEDFRTLLDRSLQSERADTLIQIPLHTNDYRYVLAVLYQHWGKPADAMRLYQEALANDLGLYMAHVRLAQMYREYKMWDQAITEARRAIETNPDDPSAVLDLGVILAEANRAAEAEAALGQAVAANPRDPRAIYHLGIVRQQLAKPAEAREVLARFVAMAPATRYAGQIADAKQRLVVLGAPEGRP